MPMRDELIQRAIQQLARTFARLLSRTGDIGTVEAQSLRAEMEALYPAFLGTSAQLLRRLSTEDILGVLRTAGYVDGERAYLLGALFEAEAELVLAEHAGALGSDDDAERGADVLLEATSLRLRALDLILEAGIEELGEPDIPQRVERLRSAVAGEPRTAASWERLHRFLAASGAHAQAEDALFSWSTALADGGSDAGDRAWQYLADVSGSFYRALTELDDAALEEGGLPRDEVEEGRLAFEERLAELTAA
ncbi:MAG TPA: DUF6483 family protein [Trueperaceae bacterium]|nr:DUF6483 family protein [Trueperaceae bacterium]